jgi:hypothetical protein
MIPLTLAQVTEADWDWRRRTSAKPYAYIRNIDPSTADTGNNEFLYLYPTPTSAYTNGLRAYYTLITDDQLTADGTTMALPERIAEEALVNYAASECLIRLSMSGGEETNKLLGLSKIYRERYETDLIAAAVEAKTGYDHAKTITRTYFV